MKDKQKIKEEWEYMADEGYIPCEAWPYALMARERAIAEFRAQGEYRIVFDRDGFRVYKKREYAK